MRDVNSEKGNLWAVVLAAGEGTRMNQFIRSSYGLCSPKQYIAFTGKRSMLQHTLDRVAQMIPPERTRIVVNPSHIKEIRSQLSSLPDRSLVFQPYNRETAPGALLPMTYILKEDPEARIAFFPSDHFIQEEDRFMRYVAAADQVVQRHPEQIALLGIEPEGPEVEYGWIAPGDPLPNADEMGARKVGRFLEKPDREAAVAFYESGYLWNTFVSVLKASTLLALTQRYLHGIWQRFERIRGAIGTVHELSTIEREYRTMESATLSRGIFERCPDQIAVLEVKGVFWSDWGSSHRVLQTLQKIGKTPFQEAKEAGREEIPYAVAESKAV
ncbi:sugar phosphate nucleotidyltransferase [Candidatus Manganitrophus noduliformans]|uniref:NTP transferase domain-containing protein n=1 Tax=Candidatus Manganitrophus noduliformans TaxID=2606439 RepID=A0A7X6DQS9_9BACT|nr:sugar phosphate nucleotidyltransferase [Candidatus Manganitrophus noduliformans]NKE71683.1 NTP transferase domain-containing protein [Candidatus Manganitrophus noduliformans]